MRVDSLAQKKVVTATPDDTVRELADRMDENGVGSLVIEDEDRPVGIVTDRDLTVRVLSEGLDPRDTTAAEVMTENPFCIRYDEPVYDLTELMSERGIRRVPVVDEDDDLVGIITLDDALRHLVDMGSNMAAVIGVASPTLPDYWWKRGRE
jgi:CBS domain-containing protein